MKKKPDSQKRIHTHLRDTRSDYKSFLYYNYVLYGQKVQLYNQEIHSSVNMQLNDMHH